MRLTPARPLAHCHVCAHRSCADVERAFAKWQAHQQAVVGFFPRLTSPGPPPQARLRAPVAMLRRLLAQPQLPSCWRLLACYSRQ